MLNKFIKTNDLNSIKEYFDIFDPNDIDDFMDLYDFIMSINIDNREDIIDYILLLDPSLLYQSFESIPGVKLDVIMNSVINDNPNNLFHYLTLIENDKRTKYIMTYIHVHNKEFPRIRELYEHHKFSLNTDKLDDRFDFFLISDLLKEFKEDIAYQSFYENNKDIIR